MTSVLLQTLEFSPAGNPGREYDRSFRVVLSKRLIIYRYLCIHFHSLLAESFSQKQLSQHFQFAQDKGSFKALRQRAIRFLNKSPSTYSYTGTMSATPTVTSEGGMLGAPRTSAEDCHLPGTGSLISMVITTSKKQIRLTMRRLMGT